MVSFMTALALGCVMVFQIGAQSARITILVASVKVLLALLLAFAVVLTLVYMERVRLRR